jgi:hypothetical protein
VQPDLPERACQQMQRRLDLIDRVAVLALARIYRRPITPHLRHIIIFACRKQLRFNLPGVGAFVGFQSLRPPPCGAARAPLHPTGHNSNATGGPRSGWRPVVTVTGCARFLPY